MRHLGLCLSCRYYKQKAVVAKVLDHFVGDVRILVDGKASGATIRLDQNDLETVIPKLGHRLFILNGIGRGNEAILTKINEEQFNVDIKVPFVPVIFLLCVLCKYSFCWPQVHGGPMDGVELKGIDYEDISKLFDA